MTDDNSFGIASLVLGILGILFFLAPYIGIFGSILAIIFSRVQQKKQKSGLATAGLVTGIIGLIFNIILIFLIIIFLVLIFSGNY